MPALLRKDTVRLLEASLDALRTALTRFAMSPAYKVRETASVNAVVTGLVGVAAELALNACICQSRGLKALIRDGAQFKSATEVLDDFRGIIKKPDKRSLGIFFSGIDRPDEHAKRLLGCVSGFKVLFVARAASVHAGVGVSRDACAHQLDAVSRFFLELSCSSKFRAYLREIPRLAEAPKDSVLLVEDLVKKVRGATDPVERASAISSLYLVVPDLPEESPDWLAALERVSIAPGSDDVSLLLDALEAARPAALRRTVVDGDSVTIPVKVRPDDPSSLPIAPHSLRTEFTKISDQWNSDIANANGRLKKGTLDLPPIQSVREMFAVGLIQAEILSAGQTLTAQQAWPPIAASLNTSGTVGPYWFIVRSTKDLKQMMACLREAAKLSRLLSSNMLEVERGLSHLSRGDGEVGKEPPPPEIAKQLVSTKSSRSKLQMELVGKKRIDVTPREIIDAVLVCVEGRATFGDAIGRLLNEVVERHTAYWVRRLAECCFQIEDAPSLARILANKAVPGAQTAARKALRLIDYLEHGPRHVLLGGSWLGFAL